MLNSFSGRWRCSVIPRPNYSRGRRPRPRDYKGRGAVVNPGGRFERLRTEPIDDGWEMEQELPPIRTQVAVDRSRSVLVRNTSPDVPFDRSVNPYRGCEQSYS